MDKIHVIAWYLQQLSLLPDGDHAKGMSTAHPFVLDHGLHGRHAKDLACQRSARISTNSPSAMTW